MNPRLESSKKWSPLPKELLEQISSVFEENFADSLEGRKVICEGRIYKEELLLRVGLTKDKHLRQKNFEASVDYNKKKDNVLKLIHFVVDCIGSMFENYMKAPDTDFPEDWAPYKVEGKEIHLMTSTENSELEKQADKLLNQQSDGLLQNDTDSEVNPDDLKAKLGIQD